MRFIIMREIRYADACCPMHGRGIPGVPGDPPRLLWRRRCDRQVKAKGVEALRKLPSRVPWSGRYLSPGHMLLWLLYEGQTQCPSRRRRLCRRSATRPPGRR